MSAAAAGNAGVVHKDAEGTSRCRPELWSAARRIVMSAARRIVRHGCVVQGRWTANWDRRAAACPRRGAGGDGDGREGLLVTDATRYSASVASTGPARRCRRSRSPSPRRAWSSPSTTPMDIPAWSRARGRPWPPPRRRESAALRRSRPGVLDAAQGVGPRQSARRSLWQRAVSASCGMLAQPPWPRWHRVSAPLRTGRSRIRLPVAQGSTAP